MSSGAPANDSGRSQHRSTSTFGIGLVAATVVGCASVVGGGPVLSPVASAGPVTDESPTALELSGPTGPTELGHVVDITDGDTIRMLIDGEEYRLRYIGIDTPETVAPDTPVEAYGPEASTANAFMVGGENVVLEMDVSDTDRFDRLLRYVWLAPEASGEAWTLVNLELVEMGLAEAIDYPPDTKYSDEFEVAEEQARAAGRGIWGGLSADLRARS